MTTIDNIIKTYGPRTIPLTVEVLHNYLKVMQEYANNPRPTSKYTSSRFCLYAMQRLDGFSAYGVWNALSAHLPAAADWHQRLRTLTVAPGRTPERLAMIKQLIGELSEALVQHGETLAPQRRKGESNASDKGTLGLPACNADNSRGDAGGTERPVRSGEPFEPIGGGGGKGADGARQLSDGEDRGERPVSVLPGTEGSGQMTLEQLKADWKQVIHGDGGNCPVCERWGKVYARNLNKTMAQSLQWLYTAQTALNDLRAWIDVPNTAPKHVLRTNQLATLRWWGLIERKPEDLEDPTQKHTGLWRMTLKGMDFVEGKVRVPKSVETYNAEVVGYSKTTVSFQEAGGTPFNYGDVLKTMSSIDTTKLFTKAMEPA